MPGEFHRYRVLAGHAAKAALSRVDAAQVQAAWAARGLAIAAPAARLLLPSADAGAWLAEDFAALGAGMRTLAAWGRQGPGLELREPPMLRDTGGHGRDVYLPLALHLHLRAFGKHYETLPQGVWTACEDALPDALNLARDVEKHAGRTPPPRERALALWQALCLAEAGRLGARDADLEWIDSVVHGVLAASDPAGPLHPLDGEALDLWTYHELCALHALADLALLTRRREWAQRVEKAALFHAGHTQPDYTTAQPWGLFAFVWNGKTTHFADQQLHDAASYGDDAAPAGQPSLIAALLLADAAASLGEFGD